MMFNVEQFRKEIIEVALHKLGVYSDSGLELLTLTCAQESMGGTYIKQIEGPALGVFQMEPKTHDDLWATFLPNRSDLAYRILGAIYLSTKPPAEFLKYNLLYAAMMCRIRYMTVSEPLPASNDILALARYWDINYNRNRLAGFPEEAVAAYNKFMHIKKGK